MQKLVLYIHASNAVIRSVEVELNTDTMPADSSVLDELAREIAAQIERRFPKSQAQDAISNILAIIKQAYWIHEPSLAGVALKVPGIIEEYTPKTGVSSINAAGLQVKIEKMAQQYQNLLQEAQSKITVLENEQSIGQNQLRGAQTRVQQLQQEQRLTKVREDTLQSSKQQLEAELQSSKQQLEDREQQIVEIVAHRNELLINIGSLETQLQQAKYNSSQQEKTVNEIQTEIELVRRENTNLANENKDLHRQIEKEQSKGREVKSKPGAVSAVSSDKTVIW